MLKVIKRSVPVVATLAVLILGALCERTSALQQKSDFVVRVNNSLSLIVPKQDIKFMLNPDNDDVVYDSINVEVRTNNKNGATVFVSTNKNGGVEDGPLRSSAATSLIGRNTKGAIQSIEQTFSVDFFPSGRWGISYDGNTYYKIGSKNDPTNFYSVESSGQSDVREIRVGAKSSETLLSDYYENTIIFTAVATYSPKTTKDIVYMQEIDAEVADSMIPNIQYQLRDMRDNKKYWVAKLDDGNVWMTQNLDLELSPSITLTPKDTNILADWTPARGTIEATQTTVDTWVNDGTTPYSYGAISSDNRTEVKGYISNTGSPDTVDGRYAFPFGTYKTQEECAASVFNSEYCEHYNVGKYYNWAAAIAKNDASAIANSGETTTINQSICPANWRLPIGYSDIEKKGEYTVLLEDAKVASSATSESGITESYYIGSNSNALVESPLFFTNAGTKSKGQPIEHFYGEYWTSTIHNEPNVDRFFFDRRDESNKNELKTNFYPNTGNTTADLGIGRSIRCVAKSMYTHKLGYYIENQRIAEQVINNSVPTQTMVFDPYSYADVNNYIKDGNKYISGWSKTGDCSGDIVAGDHVDVAQSCDVYAQFREGQRVDFYGNGGTFDDASDDNAVLLSTIPRKSLGSLKRDSWSDRKTSKEENDGYHTSSYDYSCSHDIVNIGEFGSSTYVDLEITYGVSGSNDRLYIYKDNERVNQIWGVSGTGSVDEPQSTTIRVYNNSVTVDFCTSSYYSYWNSGLGYGYWIDFLPENGFNHTIKAGTVKIPSRSGYKFLGWSTSEDAITPDFVFDPEHNEYPDNLKLYAVWSEMGAEYHNLIVSADKNIADMNIKQGSMAGTSITGTRHGNMFVFSNLTEGTNYYLVPEFVSGYEFDSWRKVDATAGASLSSTDSQNAYYTIGAGDSAVILNSRRGLLAIQNFNCASLTNVGDTTELVDIRDNSVYTVAKLADGKCWMTDNLRLDFSNLKVDISALNTNNPTADFIKVANSRIKGTDRFCIERNSTIEYPECYNTVHYNTTRINDFTVDGYNHTYDEGGIYYNWYTATAGHGTYNTVKTYVTGDICPAGWHLPSGGTDGEYKVLDIAMGGSGKAGSNTASYNLWTGSLINYNHALYYHNRYITFCNGGYGSTSLSSSCTKGYYWTSTASNSESNAYIFYFYHSNYISPGLTNHQKNYGLPMRCVSNNVIDISYNMNGGVGSVNTQHNLAKGSSAALDGFSPHRSGYAFTSWNTKQDGSGETYYPGQTITIPNEDMTLYAQWVTSSGTMQDFNCDTLGSGKTVALTDTRDGSVYTVRKLADDKCWMTDNLRLSFSNLRENITAENTNNPTANFMNAVNARPSSSSVNAWCSSSNSSCADQVLYNTVNIGDYTNIDSYGHYYDEYGVYYNWYTATAGNGTYNLGTSVTVSGDICPAGWRLPTGSTSGDFYNLNYIINQYNTGSQAAAAIRAFPNSFVPSGYFSSGNSDVGYNRTYNGHYFTATSYTSRDYAYDFVIDSGSVHASYQEYKYYGESVRCIKK